MKKNDAVMLYRTNLNAQELLERHGLPCHNSFALFHTFFEQNGTLRSDPDHLVLLVALWSCPKHLLTSYHTPIQKCIEDKGVSRLISEYEQICPEGYDRLIHELCILNQFSIAIDDQSMNFALWYNGYRILLERQKRIISEYKGWKQKAGERWAKVPKECRALQKECENSSRPEEEMSLRLAEIFLEYVKNRRTDSQYYDRYKSVEQRIERYVGAWKRSLREAETEEDTEDEKILDDIIGTLFDRLRINATKHDLLSAIGPAYICWIFANRIPKIGNPKNEKVNLFMSEKDINTLFRINDTWHKRPISVADRAEIYMFDALCKLWEQRELADPALSRLLFGRSLPIHREFMKTNHTVVEQMSKPMVKTKFCIYQNIEFSDEFLQRIFSTISKMLRVPVEAVSLKRPLSQERFDRILSESDEQKLFGFEYFNEVKNVFELASIDFKNFYDAAKSVIEDGEWKNFEKLFLIDERGVGGEHTQAWEREATDFFEQILRLMDCGWELIKPVDEWHLRNTSDGDTDGCVRDVITLLCLRKIYREYIEKIIGFSKREFYGEHSPEQYQRLRDFCEWDIDS